MRAEPLFSTGPVDLLDAVHLELRQDGKTVYNGRCRGDDGVNMIENALQLGEYKIGDLRILDIKLTVDPNMIAYEDESEAEFKWIFYAYRDTTNKPSDKITISGGKSWYHRTRDENEYVSQEKKPTHIVLYVLADGVIIQEKTITATDNWSWKIELDKYAEDGHEIVYTVNEARFEDYRKWVIGYDIINEYSPGDNTDDIPDVPPPFGAPDDGPKTGDDSNIQLWIALLVTSVVLLLLTVIFYKCKSNKNQRGTTKPV